MKRQILNTIDEQERFLGLNIYPAKESSQQDSHTISYLGTRNLYQSLGISMGLDKKLGERE